MKNIHVKPLVDFLCLFVAIELLTYGTVIYKVNVADVVGHRYIAGGFLMLGAFFNRSLTKVNVYIPIENSVWRKEILGNFFVLYVPPFRDVVVRARAWMMNFFLAGLFYVLFRYLEHEQLTVLSVVYHSASNLLGVTGLFLLVTWFFDLPFLVSLGDEEQRRFSRCSMFPSWDGMISFGSPDNHEAQSAFDIRTRGLQGLQDEKGCADDFLLTGLGAGGSSMISLIRSAAKTLRWDCESGK